MMLVVMMLTWVTWRWRLLEQTNEKSFPKRQFNPSLKSVPIGLRSYKAPKRVLEAISTPQGRQSTWCFSPHRPITLDPRLAGRWHYGSSSKARNRISWDRFTEVSIRSTSAALRTPEGRRDWIRWKSSEWPGNQLIGSVPPHVGLHERMTTSEFLGKFSFRQWHHIPSRWQTGRSAIGSNDPQMRYINIVIHLNSGALVPFVARVYGAVLSVWCQWHFGVGWPFQSMPCLKTTFVGRRCFVLGCFSASL